MPLIDLCLIHPPVSLPCEPPLGISLLAGALRARGVSLILVDANIEALEHLLQAVPPDAARSTRERRALRARSRALEQLRSPHGYRNPDRYSQAVRALGEVLQLASGERASIGLANYLEHDRTPLSSEDLRASAVHGEESPYFPYYADLSQRLAALKPRVVGISVSYLHQALPAFALAGVLRRALPAARLIMGGSLLSCWRGRLAPHSLRPEVDQLVFGDGLQPLLSSLERDDADSCLPLESRPDFSDAPWPLYLAPERIAPVSTSRGCVWGRCRYCPEALAEPTCLLMPPDRAPLLVDDVRRSSAAGMVHLTDSTIPPDTLAQLGKQRWSARWYGFSRFSSDLARAEFCRDLRSSGCAMLQLGLESASPRVLRRLRKGISLDEASLALRQLHEARVPVFLYLMFGTPGETREDALQTLDFVAAHAEHISFLNTSLLNYPLGSPAEEDLELVPLGDPADLSLYSGFVHPRGWDRRAARHFLEREFSREPSISSILRRTPPVLGANHAPFLVP